MAMIPKTARGSGTKISRSVLRKRRSRSAAKIGPTAASQLFRADAPATTISGPFQPTREGMNIGRGCCTSSTNFLMSGSTGNAPVSTVPKSRLSVTINEAHSEPKILFTLTTGLDAGYNGEWLRAGALAIFCGRQPSKDRVIG
jgi:hypothetical protein